MWIPAHPRMDEMAKKCGRFAEVIRADYRNTYDHATRALSTCFNWGLSRRVAREWQTLKPDVIHLNKQNLEDGLDLLRAVRQCAVPSVCTIHLTHTAHYLGAKMPWLRDGIARDALRKYHGVFVTVQEARRLALANFVGEGVRTQTIFNGVPLVDNAGLHHVRETKRKELGLKDDDFLVIGLGRLVAQKRPFVFLKAAQDLRHHFASARFLWVGEGNLIAQWDAWIRREGLFDVISCAGWQTDVLPFLLAADLLLHVAEYEGLPLAIVEAMAAGLPCAVTRNFASEIRLFDENTVLLLDDPAALAGRIHDRAALKTVAANARRLVENQLSLQAMAESYEHLYRDAARK